MSENRNNLSKQFLQFLPDNAVLTHNEDLHPYECDGLSAYRQVPLMVVIPETIEHIIRIVNICRKANTPIVCRGAGTSVSGGALPLENGVLLSLAKFNRILNIDPVNRLACVQPGVRNLAISQATESYGLYYAPDPSSQIVCSIGGNVAENAGGVHCLKYGLTVHNILQLKIVTIEGELLTLGGSGLDGPGYDLLALLTGSEGMLGIIVEIVVKLLPVPECANVVLAAFDEIEHAGNAVTEIIASGIIPAGLEMMDSHATRAAEEFVHAGYPVNAAAILLCELDGIKEEVSAQISQVKDILLKHRAIQTRIAKDEAERQLLWAGRKGAFPAVGRLAPDYYCMDGTIPRSKLAFVLKRISELSDEYQLAIANVFHAGDGNLHPLILYDASKPGELHSSEELGGKILELCLEVGGTITGEHGVGVEKLNQMCVQFDTLELGQFHAIKHVFDPDELLNPGKAVPSLHRCAELGAMHVHEGKLPFPDIERF